NSLSSMSCGNVFSGGFAKNPSKSHFRHGPFTCIKNRRKPSSQKQRVRHKEEPMKKGYWVVAYKSIADEAAVKAYAIWAVPAVQSFGGRFLTMSASQVQAHEAGLQQRTIIVEFDSYEIALAAHESDAYQKALQALGSGAERDYRIVEGA